MQLPANDIDTARRETAAAASTVRHLAQRMRLIATTVDQDPALARLAEAAESLAEQAANLSDAIHTTITIRALPTGDAQHTGRGSGEPPVAATHELALSLTKALHRTLTTGVTIYTHTCRRLADRAAILEEHLPTPPATMRRPGPETLIAHARALTHAISGQADDRGDKRRGGQ